MLGSPWRFPTRWTSDQRRTANSSCVLSVMSPTATVSFQTSTVSRFLPFHLSNQIISCLLVFTDGVLIGCRCSSEGPWLSSPCRPTFIQWPRPRSFRTQCLVWRCCRHRVRPSPRSDRVKTAFSRFKRVHNKTNNDVFINRGERRRRPSFPLCWLWPLCDLFPLPDLWPLTRAGELEVVLDRRLQQDDNRGLGQGVTDNKLTANLFQLLLEERRGGTQVRGCEHSFQE